MHVWDLDTINVTILILQGLGCFLGCYFAKIRDVLLNYVLIIMMELVVAWNFVMFSMKWGHHVSKDFTFVIKYHVF